MTDTEILTKVKAALGVTGAFQDATLQFYIDEVEAFMRDAGVPSAIITSAVAVGCIARGVADLWNYGSGNAKLSDYFVQRMLQLKAPGDTVIVARYNDVLDSSTWRRIQMPPMVVMYSKIVSPDVLAPNAQQDVKVVFTLTNGSVLQYNGVIRDGVLVDTNTGEPIVLIEAARNSTFNLELNAEYGEETGTLLRVNTTFGATGPEAILVDAKIELTVTEARAQNG